MSWSSEGGNPTMRADNRPNSEEGVFREKLEALRSQVAQIRDGALCLEKCSHLNDLLQRIYEVQMGLDQIEQNLLQAHLKCCISPNIKIPEELVLALVRLSEDRYGAIVVLEQEDCLNSHIQGGLTINADLKAPILEAIFYPGSALHDGAAIIRGSKIAQANTFLPLAPKSGELDALSFGSRHRAALGLSLVSDALVTVVSEEKGWISIALQGKLYPNLGTFALGVLARQNRESRDQQGGKTAE